MCAAVSVSCHSFPCLLSKMVSPVTQPTLLLLLLSRCPTIIQGSALHWHLHVCLNSCWILVPSMPPSPTIAVPQSGTPPPYQPSREDQCFPEMGRASHPSLSPYPQSPPLGPWASCTNPGSPVDRMPSLPHPSLRPCPQGLWAPPQVSLNRCLSP